MNVIEIAGQGGSTVEHRRSLLAEIADHYHRDAGFRARLEQDAPAVLRDMGLPVPPGLLVRVVADTTAVVHVVMPPDPNRDLDDEALGLVVGGVGSYATANCATVVSY